jgi:hypothetical protein
VQVGIPTDLGRYRFCLYEGAQQVERDRRRVASRPGHHPHELRDGELRIGEQLGC